MPWPCMQDMTLKKNAARLVFEKMPEKNAWAYNSMLMGMLTHDAKEEANIWFKEMQEKKIPVELECYNKLLATLAPKGMSWEEIKKRLCEIAEAGLRPNLATFNNALAAISASKVDEIVEHLEEVIGEMKALDIEPSLGTWAACLDAVYVKGNSRDIGYVTKILDTHVAGKEFTMRDVHDFEFFYSAMKVAHSLNSSTLAQKINETLEIGMNYHFIGHFEKSRIYYFMYFELLAESESVDTVMDFYTKYVPYTFNIKQKHIWTMLNMIRMQEDGYKFLRRILVDARGLFPYTIDFAVLVLDMVKKQAEQDEDSEMKEYYADVAWLVLDWFAILNESSLISVTAKHMGSDIVSNVLSVLLNNNIKDIGRCWTAFQIGKDLQGEIGKDLRESVLEKLGRGCIEAGEATYATECLEFMHKNKCRGTAEMAEDVLDLRKEEDEDEFPEKEREKIQNILKESSGWIYKTGKQFTTDKPMRREIQFKM